MQEVDIVSKLIEHGPIVAVLIWVIWRDQSRTKVLETENRELHRYIRESEKEAISYIKDVNVSIKNLTDKIK